jgi:hypothetical protein
MNINKDILAFYWLRFVMWFYFIFHGMTTKSSKEVIIYHVILHWPVDIDRLKIMKKYYQWVHGHQFKLPVKNRALFRFVGLFLIIFNFLMKRRKISVKINN